MQETITTNTTTTMPATIPPPPSKRNTYSCPLLKLVVLGSSTLGVMLRRIQPLTVPAAVSMARSYIRPELCATPTENRRGWERGQTKGK